MGRISMSGLQVRWGWELRAKSGKPLGRYFPEVVAMLHELEAKEFVVDGKIVIELAGSFSFDAWQTRLHPVESRIRKLSVATPAKLMLFLTCWQAPRAP
jgi:ATP-dependent DNA ligase